MRAPAYIYLQTHRGCFGVGARFVFKEGVNKFERLVCGKVQGGESTVRCCMWVGLQWYGSNRKL